LLGLSRRNLFRLICSLIGWGFFIWAILISLAVVLPPQQPNESCCCSVGCSQVMFVIVYTLFFSGIAIFAWSIAVVDGFLELRRSKVSLRASLQARYLGFWFGVLGLMAVGFIILSRSI